MWEKVAAVDDSAVEWYQLVAAGVATAR